MITYVKGNLFKSPAKVLVNTVNTEGVMGKGIAKEFKAIYPEMFEKYRHFCETGQFKIGNLWLYKTPNKWILNFPTKTTWRQPSEMSYIEAGLKNFAASYAKHGITSVAFPPLGCGNGELNWEKHVRPLMEKYLKTVPIDVFIHYYTPEFLKPEHKDVKEIKKWLRSEPQNLPFSEVWDDLSGIIKKGIRIKVQDSSADVMVNLTQDEQGAELVSINGSNVTKEALMEAWSILRTYGFVSAGNMPGELSAVSAEVIALLSRLEYCPQIKMSSRYEEINSKHAAGIQLQPKINPEFSRTRQNGIIQIQ